MIVVFVNDSQKYGVILGSSLSREAAIKRRELSGDLVLTEDWCIDQGSDWLFSWEGPDSYARKKQAEKACFKNFDWTTTTNERQMR